MAPLRGIILLAYIAATTSAAQLLQTSSFSTCQQNSSVSVQNVDIKFNNVDKTVTFNVAGTSKAVQFVTAVLNVTAYGTSVYSNAFNPCERGTFVAQLCPVPAGFFSASGVQVIPPQFASMVPSIAFQFPDIAAQATLQLKALDTGKDVACLQSQVTNGKTVNLPVVSYVAASVGAVALGVAGVSSVLGAMAGGTASVGGAGMSPSFGDIVGLFQGFAINGMMTVQYPLVYRNFAKSFGFSTGLVVWGPMQTAIDTFRQKTGGNLTENNFPYMQNVTLVFNTGNTAANPVLKRSMSVARQIVTNIGGTPTPADNHGTLQRIERQASGISAYVEQYTLPASNTFMTVLLVVAIIIVAIIVSILLFKLILEAWAVFGSFPKSLGGFRRRYWGTIARSLTQLILLLYGIWTTYCVFQFLHGDSWAAKILAGVTLGLFSAVLAFFTFKIWRVVRAFQREDGDASALYLNKETWVKYSLFYDAYRQNYWWIFIPAIAYALIKGALVAALDGHGLAQTIAQLIVEVLFLGLLLFIRPYERRSGNIINIFIQVVRVLSVVCILIFVQELGIPQTAQTVTGVVLIAIQSLLTISLVILLLVNAAIQCCKANPHRARRKAAEAAASHAQHRDAENLTPLDARNSLLIKKVPSSSSSVGASSGATRPWAPSRSGRGGTGGGEAAPSAAMYFAQPTVPVISRPMPLPMPRPLNVPSHRRGESREELMTGAASIAGMSAGSGTGMVPRGGPHGRSESTRGSVPAALGAVGLYGGYGRRVEFRS